MKCPGCGHKIKFGSGLDIEVNAESRQTIEVEECWELVKGCKNPFCKWSKVEGVYQ